MNLKTGIMSHSEEKFVQRPKGMKQFIVCPDLQAVYYWWNAKYKKVAGGEIRKDGYGRVWRALEINLGVRPHHGGQCSSDWGLQLTTWKPTENPSGSQGQCFPFDCVGEKLYYPQTVVTLMWDIKQKETNKHLIGTDKRMVVATEGGLWGSMKRVNGVKHVVMEGE